MAERSFLSKISVNSKAELLMKQPNQAIQVVKAEEALNLNNINLLQYVTAYVIEYLKRWVKRPNS